MLISQGWHCPPTQAYSQVGKSCFRYSKFCPYVTPAFPEQWLLYISMQIPLLAASSQPFMSWLGSSLSSGGPFGWGPSQASPVLLLPPLGPYLAHRKLPPWSRHTLRRSIHFGSLLGFYFVIPALLTMPYKLQWTLH